MLKSVFRIFFYTIFSIINSFCFSQHTKTDSIFSVLKTEKQDTNIVNSLNELAWNFKSTNHDTAIILSTQALKLAEKIKWQMGIGRSEHCLGWFNYLKSNYRLSLQHYFKAMEIWENLAALLKAEDEHTIKNLKSKTLGNIGIVHWQQGDYPKALEYDFKALKLKEELADKKGIAKTLGNIGIVYWQIGDYQKSLEYYLKGLKLNEELGDKNGIANALGNIGLVYKAQKKYSLAMQYYLNRFKLDEESGNKYNMALNLQNIGGLFITQAQQLLNSRQKNELCKKALDHFYKVLKMAKELGNRNLITTISANIGTTYYEEKNYLAAKEYFNESLKEAEGAGWMEGCRGNEKNLAQVDSALGNYKESYNHYKKFVIYRDSLFNEENTKKTVQTQMQYDFDKKEAETKAEQDKKDVIANEEKQKQKIVIASVSVGLFLVLILASVIFRNLRQNQKKNKIITEQKEIVEHQKELVEEKQKEILDSIRYAKRIQTALITSEKYIAKNLNRIINGNV